jgi:hypothetical protein
MRFFGYSSSNTVTWQVTSFSCSIIVERSDMSVSIIYSINRLIHCIRHSIKELVFFRHGISYIIRTGLIIMAIRHSGSGRSGKGTERLENLDFLTPLWGGGRKRHFLNANVKKPFSDQVPRSLT